VKADPGNAATQKDLLEVQCCGAAGPPASGVLLQLGDTRLAALVSSMLPSAGSQLTAVVHRASWAVSAMKARVITVSSQVTHACCGLPLAQALNQHVC
jgi:hypothetical protein